MDQPLSRRSSIVEKKQRKKRKSFWFSSRVLFVLPAMIYLIAIFLYPIYRTIMMGFQDYSISSIGSGSSPFIGLENYIHLFTQPLMWQVFMNTLYFVLGSIVFQVTIGMALAVFFTKKFPLNSLIRGLLLVPWLLPLIVSGTAFRWILDQSHGVLNWVLMKLHFISEPIGWLVSPDTSLLSTIITNIWVGIPFSMVILYSGLKDIPNELYEAGAIDGCSAWQKFWYITLPSLKPVLAIVLTLALIYTLKVFDIVMILTGGGPANSSQILSTWSYDLSFQQLSFGEGAAVSNIMILISLVFCFFYVKATKE
ncbi:sugar ABC transporter permease [Halobacillus salinarum]|uniref:Sugar ABC transporter permease n=1 Tax=Halobacillus salinarum TaxID=2932257 RepID=A0ABY4EMM3_9BACI|nr:sugar ABC transporter permease [Halobacillus salinarum]UOQ45424.1 sugar ABC transporter permease [Halobacillus salinarum]